jgi:CDP-glycerol glycerophosphotransferase (TagB/SpsB family)
LRKFGIYLNFSRYGSGDCDRILVGGEIAASVLKGTGISENRISRVGLPKYDAFFAGLRGYQPVQNQKKVYLYATSTMVLQDDGNIKFLKKLTDAAKNIGFYLVVKLHPRLPQGVKEVCRVLNTKETSTVEIIKGGDETFDLLKRADAFITVSSTMILDALLMDKECIVANYLAGESRLEYGKYDAVHLIENEKDIEAVLKSSLTIKKSYENKRALLEDELYKLDGRAGWRAAKVIEAMI